jgi:adenine-specific DNA-methyltransferase
MASSAARLNAACRRLGAAVPANPAGWLLRSEPAAILTPLLLPAFLPPRIRMPTRTELIWDGKYDAGGKRVAPLRVALPFQTVETINETAQDRDKYLLYQLAADEQPWRNRLIWGDKKYVLPSLLPEFAGKVNLIYIDPPFDTGADFSFTAAVPEPYEEEDGSFLAFTKQPSIIEQKAYRDTWGRGLDSYLQWFYESVVLLQEMLAEDGSLYVHLDWHVAHYAKAVLDEVFGQENFRNQITWKRSSIVASVPNQWRNSQDILLFYAKTDQNVFNVQFGEYSESSKKHFSYKDQRGVFQPVPLLGSGKRNGETGKPWRGIDPNSLGNHGMHWLKSPSKLDELDTGGLIYWPAAGGVPRLKYYLEEAKGRIINDFWDDINPINSMGAESLRYATQKPEALVERVLKASSNENDLILDCFVGSGTTAAVAEKLNRRWIACDLGRFAIHTTRKRLLAIPNVRPFIVQNLGKYERQLWQAGQFAREGPETPEQATRRHRAYTEFILQLYHAQPVQGYTWLHGSKAGRMVHVGSVEAPVSLGDVKNMVVEFKKAMGTGKDAPKTNGIDVLGWDFAFELHELASQQAEAANVKLLFKRIPRDVMDKRAVDEGDISFFELAALGVSVKTGRAGSVSDRSATLTLTDFVIPPDDVPDEVRKAVKHWSQWIDYWSVDWDHKGDTFHNQWQAFRTRKEPKLPLTATHPYPEAGEYKVVVKVIDILGNDTTKTVKVRVK